MREGAEQKGYGLFSGKPIIGIAGGIGSGKSHIARMLGELGCAVIDSDAQVKTAYCDPGVRAKLREWWGDSVVTAAGLPDRKAIAQKVFSDENQRKRLEGLLHPLVGELRDKEMEELAKDPAIVAFVWDTPLLFEAGLTRKCDAILFVNTPLEIRQERVARTRGWSAGELLRRENLQWPLDRKRQLSDYVIQNTAEAGDARDQVRDVLSRILARFNRPEPT
jgi:dephospho-CoA kinase